jgi:predicted DCC family thiol-disulfide oxidoreductase YuxK
MKKIDKSGRTTVIFDGQCQFCKNCVTWVSKRLPVDAIAYQGADLSVYGLTEAQCAKQVYVIDGQSKYGGISAVRCLLRKRRNYLMYLLLTIAGPLGNYGYKWVAANRNSNLVKLLNRVVVWLNHR